MSEYLVHQSTKIAGVHTFDAECEEFADAFEYFLSREVEAFGFNLIEFFLEALFFIGDRISAVLLEGNFLRISLFPVVRCKLGLSLFQNRHFEECQIRRIERDSQKRFE